MKKRQKKSAAKKLPARRKLLEVTRGNVARFLKAYKKSIKSGEIIWGNQARRFSVLSEVVLLFLEASEIQLGVSSSRIIRDVVSVSCDDIGKRSSDVVLLHWCFEFLKERKLVKDFGSKTKIDSDGEKQLVLSGKLVPSGEMEQAFGLVRQHKKEANRKKLAKERLEKLREEEEAVNLADGEGWTAGGKRKRKYQSKKPRQPAPGKTMEVRRESEGVRRWIAERELEGRLENLHRAAKEAEDERFEKAARKLARRTGRYQVSAIPKNPEFTFTELAELIREELDRADTLVIFGYEKTGRRPGLALVQVSPKMEVTIRWDVVRRFGENMEKRLRSSFSDYDTGDETTHVGGNDSPPLTQELGAAAGG